MRFAVGFGGRGGIKLVRMSVTVNVCFISRSSLQIDRRLTTANDSLCARSGGRVATVASRGGVIAEIGPPAGTGQLPRARSGP